MKEINKIIEMLESKKDLSEQEQKTLEMLKIHRMLRE